MLQFDADNLWFTADTHFGHDRIRTSCHRPFGSVHEMDEALVERWNAVVPEDGVVFHLGDFCLDTPGRWEELFWRLHGTKYLIAGNHDLRTVGDGFNPGFADIREQMTVKVGGRTLILNHYPLLCFGGTRDEEWQLFGHVHSGPLNTDNHARIGECLKRLRSNQYDVGVDNNGFAPVSFGTIREIIGGRK